MREDNEAINSEDPRAAFILERLLAAAAADFRAPDYPVFDGLALSNIARRAGVSERTAYRYFSVEQIRQALPAYLFDLERDPMAEWSAEQFQRMEEQLVDRSTPLAEAIVRIATSVWQTNLEDPTLRAQMALWPYAEGNDEVQTQLGKLYRHWDNGSRAVVDAFFTEYAEVLSARRGWMSTKEFAIAATVMMEGFAIRAALHQASGGEGFGFPPELPGRIMMAVFGSLVDLGDGEHPLDDLYRRLDEALGRSRTEPDVPS